MAGKRKGGFVEGHDPRRGVRTKKERTKQVPSAVVNAVESGMDPDEAMERVKAGQFKPGHDPRRPTPEELAAMAPRPGVARAAARLGWIERLPWLLSVIDGVPQERERVIPRKADAKGNKEDGPPLIMKFKETPKLTERLEAFKQLSEMTGVKTLSVTDGDGDPLPPQQPTFIFSNLTTAQLQQLEELHRLAQPKGLDPSKRVG